MVTLPPAPPGAPEPPGPRLAHEARQLAESFGQDPGRYDRARPRYPSALVDRIVAAMPGTELLDVGIGTGIAASQFAAAGCRVRGVDPDARMAELARRRGFAVDVVRFEDWEGPPCRFDGVVAAQAWHWVEPVAGAARAAAALRDGAPLAVFWNASALPDELRETVAEVYRRVLPDARFAAGVLAGLGAYERQLAAATAGVAATGSFGEVERWRFDWDQPYTGAQWLEQVPTFGGHQLLPPGVLDELLAGLRRAIDAVGGAFTMRYASVCVVATRSARTSLGAER